MPPMITLLVLFALWVIVLPAVVLAVAAVRTFGAGGARRKRYPVDIERAPNRRPLSERAP
jgi:hypothetical protein